MNERSSKLKKLLEQESDKLILGENLSTYGKDFQIKLLALLIKDRIFAFSILPILEAKYFSDIWTIKIYSCIKEYIEKYSSTPTIENIKILLKQKETNINKYEVILESIESISLEDRDFVIDNSKRFCFTKFRLLELEKERVLLEQGSFEDAQAIAIESYKHTGSSTRKILDLKTDYEKIFEDETLHRPVEMPFPTINKCSKGGPGNGNLVISVAFSNFGKTAALTAYARHANSLGKNVAFFSFEIGGVDIIRRYIAGSLGIKQEDLKYNKKQVKDKIVDSTLGNFRLIEERATNANVNQIRTDLEYLKSTGFFPDVVMVDSLNQLKIIGEEKWRNRDDNQRFEYISEDLRDLANEYQIPLHTVFQTNRTGSNIEVGDINSIGKAIEPFQVADMLMMYTQTPEQFRKGVCINILLKNRLGPKNIVLECAYDPNMGTFKEIQEVPQLLMLNDKQKNEVRTTVSNMREKLKTGVFDKKGN